MRDFLARLWAMDGGEWQKRTALGLVIAAVLAVTMLLWSRFGDGDTAVSQDTLAALNLDHAPAADRAAAPWGSYSPARPSAQDRLFRGREPDLVDPGVTQAARERARREAERETMTSEEEKEMMRRFAPIVSSQYSRMSGIIGRYKRKYPVIGHYHADLQSIAEYRAVEREYWKDKDLYKWARKTFRLKSVRDHVWKYAKKSEMWQAGMLITLDFLKNPPPKPLYDEAKRVMGSDPGLQDFYTDFWSMLLQNVGTITSGEGLPPGTDMSPLQRFITDMSPSAPQAGGGLGQGEKDLQTQANTALDQLQKSPRPRASGRKGR